MVELRVDDASCSTMTITPSVTNLSGSNKRPAFPDRQAFQRSLSRCNELISARTQEIDSILGRNGQKGQIDILREAKIPLRQKREELKKKADLHKPELVELKRQLENTDKMLSDIENDLVYKREDKLKARLKELEDRYNQKGFTTVRDEQALVKEIDKLKRNLNKLAKYHTTLEERRNIEGKYRDAKSAHSALLKSIRQLTCELQRKYQEIGELHREAAEMKNSLRILYTEKKELIEKYEKQREDYTTWLKNSRRLQSSAVETVSASAEHPYPATFPVVHKNQQTFSQSDDDEEQLEPFYEQKVACKRLIAYLESLQSQMDDSDRNAQSTSTSYQPETSYRHRQSGEESDSADDLPPSFVTLKKYTSLPARPSDEDKPCSLSESSFVPKLKKKLSKKSAKKPNQPISHQFELIRLFDELEVKWPVHYCEVERALNEIRELLEFYKQQTNIVVWEESDYQHMPVMSESEYTVDSAWNGSTDMSERGSVCGSTSCTSPPSPGGHLYVHPRALPSSPLCSDPIIDQLASIALPDEGIESKDSTH